MAVFYRNYGITGGYPGNEFTTFMAWGDFGKNNATKDFSFGNHYVLEEINNPQGSVNVLGVNFTNTSLEPAIFPRYEQLDIKSFVMGENSGFGIGIRNIDSFDSTGGGGSPQIFEWAYVTGFVDQYNEPLCTTELDQSSCMKTGRCAAIVFVNKEGMTGGAPIPEFVSKYYTLYNSFGSSFSVEQLYTPISQGVFRQYTWAMDPNICLETSGGTGGLPLITSEEKYNLIAAGKNHFLMGYGYTLYAWGANESGQCNVPVGARYTGNLKQIVAGASHSIALFENGRIIAWGSTANGRINIPAGLDLDSAEENGMALESKVIQLACGLDHTIALKENGTVVCWGGNTHSQCSVPAGLSGVASIGSGYYHSMAVKTDGTVVCWGLTASGQCTVPETVGTGGFQISGGMDHTVLLTKNKNVICWGGNTYNQLDTPVSPPEKGGTLWRTISDNQYSLTREQGTWHSHWYAYPVTYGENVKKIICGKNSTIALYNFNNLGWDDVAGPGFSIPKTREAVAIAKKHLNTFDKYESQPKSVPSPARLTFESGYTEKLHDRFKYKSSALEPRPYYTEIWPIAKNDTTWLEYRDPLNNLLVHDSYNKIDFSGCSMRPRRLGADYLPFYDAFPLSYGANIIDPYRVDVNTHNSGYWCFILINRKFALACAHYAGPNLQVNNVKWMLHDNSIISRDLTQVNSEAGLIPLPPDIFGLPYHPYDLYLYELDQPLKNDELSKIAIYNKWAKFKNFTGRKTIDFPVAVYKNFYPLVSENYGTVNYQKHIGRRVWGIDGQERLVSTRSLKVKETNDEYFFAGNAEPITGITSGITYYLLETVMPARSDIEPHQCGYEAFVGDSGSPFFIQGLGHTAYYNVISGVTHQPTIMLAPPWTTFTNHIFSNGYHSFIEMPDEAVAFLNNFMESKGVPKEELIVKIDIDVRSTPISEALPSLTPQKIPNEPPIRIPTIYFDGVTLNPFPGITSQLPNNTPFYAQGITQRSLIVDNQITLAEGIIEQVNNNVIKITGITGSFSYTGASAYIISSTNDSDIQYYGIKNYIIPKNNILGTTAGINDVLDQKAEEINFDINNPFD